ncbi:MAG: hypothetical protein APR63_09535 [Desulfuromonas sp. SDB]|nr:MAG: hypothetical protein APR63_09535 [Desulfuromonas sp. SDB]
MTTMSRKQMIPVYDEDGNLMYYVVEAPPTPFDRKLKVGGSHKTELEIESSLRRHKKELGWKEPPIAKLKCLRCGEIVPKEHPTQKYCKKCGPIVKVENRNRRQREYARRKREERRAKDNAVTEE